MKLTRSSIAQLSCQGIGWSSQPKENCHPSIRSTLSPIYPVWTNAALSRKGRGRKYARNLRDATRREVTTPERPLLQCRAGDPVGDGAERVPAAFVLLTGLEDCKLRISRRA